MILIKHCLMFITLKAQDNFVRLFSIGLLESFAVGKQKIVDAYVHLQRHARNFKMR